MDQFSGSTPYTEITDFNTEVNGLITFDRKVVKVAPARFKELNTLFRKVEPQDSEKVKGLK